MQGCAFWGSQWWIITFRGPKSPKTPILGAWVGISTQINSNRSSDLCIRLTWNLAGSGGQQQRLRGWSRMVVKQFQDGGRPPFWKSIYRHYLSEKSSDFDEILYTAQQQIKNWTNVTWPKMKKLHWADCEFERTYFLFTYQVISVIITTLIIQHFFTLSLRAQNLPFQQILPVLILFRPWTAFTTTEPDRTYHASLFIFSSFFSLIFCLSRVVD